jgi:hypothetical protein
LSTSSPVHFVPAEAHLPPYPQLPCRPDRLGSAPTGLRYSCYREAARRSADRVGITTLVRPHIGETIAFEPDHHFRQSLVRNPEH